MKKILFITPSNIGDVVTTTPVLGHLLNRPDRPEIWVLTSPKAAGLFEHDPAIKRLVIYDKYSSWMQKLSLTLQLRKEGFCDVVDMRDTLFPVAILGVRGVMSILHRRGRGLGGKYAKNAGLHAVQVYWRGVFGVEPGPEQIKFHIHIPEEAHQKALHWMTGKQPFVAIASGAGSDLKRWPLEKFTEIARRVIHRGAGQVVLVGGPENNHCARQLVENVPGVLDLVGKTSLVELAAVLRQSCLLISNDSGPMHLAAALGTPVMAIFGPSNPKRYGPFGVGHAVVRKELLCSPCSKVQCPLETHACMKDLPVDDVWRTLEQFLPLCPVALRARVQSAATPAKCTPEHPASRCQGEVGRK